MSGPRFPQSPWPMARDAYLDWLKGTSEEGLKVATSIWGKPRVRVPVERQIPNEADL